MSYRLAVVLRYALVGCDLRLVRNVHIVFEDGLIAEIELGKPSFVDEVHECEDCIAIPGLVNCHVHMLHAAFKDKIDFTGGNAVSKVRSVKKSILSSALRDEIFNAIRDTACFMLKTGTTTILDFVEGGAEKVNLVYDALRCTPINFMLLAEPNHEFSHDEILLGSSRFPPHAIYPLIQIKDRLKGFGLPNPMTLPIEALRQMARVAEDHRLMRAIHVADIPPKPWEGVGAWKTQTEMAIDFFRADLLIHMNYAFERDVELLSQRDCSVVCCTRLTQILGLKPAPIDLMLKKGVNVVLGTGSPMLISPDMFREMEATLNLYRFLGRDVKPIEVLKMATVNASKALNEKIGIIDEGYRGDVLLLKLDVGNINVDGDLIASIVKRACGLNVHRVYIAGKPIS